MRANRGGLQTVSAKVPPELAEAVKHFAGQQTVSWAMNELLRHALEDKGVLEVIKRDLKSEGYQAGLRQGLHEARKHMEKLYGGK